MVSGLLRCLPSVACAAARPRLSACDVSAALPALLGTQPLSRLTIELNYGSVLLRDARIGGKQSKRASERNGILTAREKAHDPRFRAETTSEDKKHGANFASKQNKLMNKCAIDADGANLHLNYMIVCNNFSFWIFGSQMR